MKVMNKLGKITAVLGVSVLMSTAAYADSGTCSGIFCTDLSAVQAAATQYAQVPTPSNMEALNASIAKYTSVANSSQIMPFMQTSTYQEFQSPVDNTITKGLSAGFMPFSSGASAYSSTLPPANEYASLQSSQPLVSASYLNSNAPKKSSAPKSSFAWLK